MEASFNIVHFDLSLNRSKIVKMKVANNFSDFEFLQFKVNTISFHYQLNDTEQQEYYPIKKFLIKKWISERLFNSHLHSPQHDQQRGFLQHQRKIIFPLIQVPQENMDQKYLISSKYQKTVEKMEYIQNCLRLIKRQHSSRKNSTENNEIVDNDQFMLPHYQNKKKLNFNKMFQSMVTQIKLIRKEIKMVHKTIVQKIKTKNLSDDLRLFLTTLNIMENLN
ncbi:unnamed protein product [Paramecium pentaurelia]|uniref:Uncharacterized protein n=1 Tax=Paramecium pentaurelia TaxID=43138 RepID=A0A8S1WRE2_9CILI|nr:unnamed protein product [Paramecium pentaurelia]